jgi:hypothetical protein
MRYMLLVYKEETQWDLMSEEEQEALVQRAVEYSRPFRDSGAFLAGDRLLATSTATTVRMKDGQPLVTDGPFAETKEQLAGYTMIEAANLDEVLAYVAHHPLIQGGFSIEIRPVREPPPLHARAPGRTA